MTRYAGFWARLLARMIDGLLLWIASWILQLMFFGALFWSSLSAVDPFFVQLGGGAIFALLEAAYFVWGHYRYGTTLGKRMLGIRVVDFTSGARITLPQSLGRYLGTWLSWALLGIGFIIAGFQAQKRALHDLMAGTACVYS